MDEYPYPLFFEARDLTDQEKKKIGRYFKKKRDSGGGDCSKINNVEGNVYEVSFKEKQDQERVLEKKFHTISFTGGELHLTVRQTSSPQAQDQPSIPRQYQACAKQNMKQLKKNIKMDIFLLLYLSDNPKAFKLLQKELSLINCTVEFDVEEQAVVKWDCEMGAAAETWELQVDQIFIRLFEKYRCQYVLEPKQVKMVLQDHSFATDDMKVYAESGYVVVVGDTEAVKEKIAILERRLPTQRKLPVVEKEVKLVEDEFSREMTAQYPDVKVTRGTNIITLEGPDDQVQSGAAKLDELIQKIREKRVELHPDLLSFMSTSGIVSRYQARFQQSLRSPVTLEVGSDLVLSSLSLSALDEAEAAVMRDLIVASVELQGAAAAPPDLNRLKDILNRAKSQVNCSEPRVEVHFISSSTATPATKVQLVGYTEHVNKLKDLVHDYQANQISTQEVLNLQFPELVDRFDKILQMIGMKQTDVTLKVSHFPDPRVLLSGPRCRVDEALQTLRSTLTSLTKDTLVFDGAGALRYFQGDGKVNKELVESSCQVLIWEQEGVYSLTGTTKPRSISIFSSPPSPPSSSSSSSSPSSFTPRSTRSRFNTVGGSVVNNINLEIKLISLEQEQANVFVAPMFNKQLASTNIGLGLLKKGGNTVQLNFIAKSTGCTLVPGDVLQVDASSSLSCSKIYFVECMPWDGVTGSSVQTLSNGLKKCLDLCGQQGFSSIAIPVIGPGIVLKYPLTKAIQVLTENIQQFGSSAGSTSLSTIHIIIKPGYPDSEQCYYEVHKWLSSIMNQGGRALFRSLTSDLDDVNMTVRSGAKLQLVFGDITNETTDAVVNTTDFITFDSEGVCKDILTLAGAGVAAELKAARVNTGEVFVSKPGQFPCKVLLHVCGQRDTGVIEELVRKIIDYCENFGFVSVAIPAICAGVGGLDPGDVAGAILRGVKVATSSARLRSLTTIRVILFKINVFLAFKEEATQMFHIEARKVSIPQLPQTPQHSSLSADLSMLCVSSAIQQSTFTFLGLCRQDVNKAMEKLKNLYETQCSSHLFKKEELQGLTIRQMLDIKKLMEKEGISMQKDLAGNLTLNGIIGGVIKVLSLINEFVHDNLMEMVRLRDEDELYTRVMWCILGQNGNWERLPRAANLNLEKGEIAGGIRDAQGVLWQVDLQNMEATTGRDGPKTEVKRLKNLTDFVFPLYWDSVTTHEEKVALRPSSQEYKTVKQGFKLSCAKTVLKIDRLQNINLRRAYEARKKHISEKNVQLGGAGEKLLYHGTTQDNCDSIIKNGFNRRFAGQNATMYGEGTYFAVKASYSANTTYSKPAADGSQLMFVAKVLTGVYTNGESGMRVPPARDEQHPHDRYDSVVDATHNPSMYIVFHDDQAYPDYLITFK